MAAEHKEISHHSGSLHSFMLGILVGVVITLLFTTKKGRRILKNLTDDGMERVSKWEDLLGQKIEKKLNEVDKNLEEKEFIDIVEEPVVSVTHVERKETKATPTKEPEEKSETHHAVRRFFKAAKKK